LSTMESSQADVNAEWSGFFKKKEFRLK